MHEAKIELQSIKQQQFKINSNEIVSLKHQLKKLEEKNLFLNSLLDKKNLECESSFHLGKHQYKITAMPICTKSLRLDQANVPNVRTLSEIKEARIALD